MQICYDALKSMDVLLKFICSMFNDPNVVGLSPGLATVFASLSLRHVCSSLSRSINGYLVGQGKVMLVNE